MYPAPRHVYSPSLSSRTSIAAISSLVLGIVGLFTCFLPIFGPLAIIVGIAALVAISRSEGTLKGTGLAIAGSITGLVSLVISLFVVFSAYIATNSIKDYAGLVPDAQRRDESAAAAWLGLGADGSPTADVLTRFDDSVTNRLGEFQSAESDLSSLFAWEARKDNTAAAQVTDYENAGYSVFECEGTFEKGMARILVLVDDDDTDDLMPLGKIVNLAVIPEGASEVFWLFQPGGETEWPDGQTPTSPPH